MGPATDRASSYLRTFGIVVTTLLGLLALVNVGVDPYSFFGTPKIAGFNDRKPLPADHIYALKTIASWRSGATSMEFGSSRTEIGLDPANPAWGRERCYNLAVPGADMQSARRYFEQVRRERPLRKALLAVEYPMFDGSARELDASAWALEPDGSLSLTFLGRLVSTTFSADALAASARTLVRSQRGAERLYRDDGLRLWNDKLLRLEAIGGQRWHFVRLLEAMLAEFQPPGAGNLHYLRALEAFRTVLRIAHSDHIDLKIVLSPEHVWLAVARVALDPSDPAAMWRRDLVRINGEEAASAGSAPFPLWDFSGSSGPNLESVPAEGDSVSRMRWYWELEHYKVELGDVVLARVLSGEVPSADVGADFGVLLDEENVGVRLDDDRHRREAWARRHPETAAFLVSLTASSRRPDPLEVGP